MRKRTTNIDVLVVVTCIWGATLYGALEYGRFLGRQEPKKCAAVPGEQVVSSTADRCTYAASYGRATKTRRAL